MVETDLIHVLLIEDDPEDILLIQKMLENVRHAIWRFRLTCALTLTQGFEMVTRERPDVILLDLTLPESQGLDTFANVRARSDSIPIVILTGLDDEHAAMKAVRKGAQDYVIKGRADGRTLVHVLHYAIERGRLLSKLEQYASELLAHKASFRNVVERTTDCLVVVDGQGVVRFMNAAAEAAFGRKAERALGRPFWIPVIPGQTKEVEAPQPDGGRLILEMQVVETEWEGETACLATLRDITARKRAEEAVKQAQRYAHNLIDSSLDMIISVDKDRRIVEFNRAAQQTFGYRAAEVLGKPVEILYAEAREGIHVHTEVEKSGRHIGEVLNKRKNGETFTAYLSSAILRDADGKYEGTMGISRDITELKRAHAELRSAKEAAEAANQAKSAFLANVSHEIRTPLNGILGMTQLIMDTDLTAEQRDYVDKLNSSADSLMKLIHDVLDFAKIEAGKMTVEPMPFDLERMVEEVADLLALKAEEKSLNLAVRYPMTVPRGVIGDPGQLRQVLSNLVSNAIKFTQKGHVLINVECEERQRERAVLRISVEDTGIGVPEDKYTYIFDKFTQVDASTTRKYGGLGLGLAISKQLTELMGGRIGARARPGGGSVFWFSLPMELNLSAPPIIEPDDLKDVRVLVVDDNDINRRLFQEMTAAWGMRSVSCGSPAEALELLRKAAAAGKPYEMGLLDFQMPDMDGENLGRAIKADPAIKDTMLVMLTSLGRRGDDQRLKEAGFASYIVKPVHFSELREVLSRLWKAREQKTEIPFVTRYALAQTTAKDKGGSAKKSVDARMLVVDDNILNQKVAARMLEKMGCRVDVASNGKEAVKMMESFSYDMVFMDCQMPEMDGFEATVEIRKLEAGAKHTPIMAMTANAMQGTKAKCLEAGMDDFVLKPMKLDEVRNALVKWLKPSTNGPG